MASATEEFIAHSVMVAKTISDFPDTPITVKTLLCIAMGVKLAGEAGLTPKECLSLAELLRNNLHRAEEADTRRSS